MYKIIYRCTESHYMVLEKHRGVQFISRSQPKDHASVVDDLKTYHKSEQKAAVVSSKLKVMFKVLVWSGE